MLCICFLLAKAPNRLARLLVYSVCICLVYALHILSICILYAPNKVGCAIVLYILSIYLAYAYIITY